MVDGLIPRKGGVMPAPRKYPDELRDRAQRLGAEAMSEDASLSMNAAVRRIAPKVGVVPDTLRGWVRRAQIDEGRRPGTTSEDAASMGVSDGLCKRGGRQPEGD